MEVLLLIMLWAGLSIIALLTLNHALLALDLNIVVSGSVETDSRQVFNRLSGCWRTWGEKHNYFETKEDADTFQDEIAFMLANQMAAPNSPQWFNTGLHSAYGIAGSAQGHKFVDPETGKIKNSTSASFCFCLRAESIDKFLLLICLLIAMLKIKSRTLLMYGNNIV